MSFMVAELPGCFCVPAGSSIGQSGAVAISCESIAMRPYRCGNPHNRNQPHAVRPQPQGNPAQTGRMTEATPELPGQ